MQTQIDITELIPKQGQLQMCNKCIRYIKSILFLINYSGMSRSQKIGGGIDDFFEHRPKKQNFPRLGGSDLRRGRDTPVITSFFLFNSYLQPPNTWISAQLESRELLTVCLKRIKGLNKEVNKIY